MKTVFIVLIALIAAFVCPLRGEMINNYSGITRRIELQRVTKTPDLRHRSPEINPLYLECLLDEDNACLIIVSNKEISADVFLLNMNDGAEYNWSLYFSDYSQSVDLIERGYYQLIIEVGETVMYIGEFLF